MPSYAGDGRKVIVEKYVDELIGWWFHPSAEGWS
jgi:hypothetical protein